MINRNDFIGKVLFIDSTCYFHKEILDAGLALCSGVTEDGMSFRFTGNRQIPEPLLDLGAIPTRERSRVFLDYDTLFKTMQQREEKYRDIYSNTLLRENTNSYNYFIQYYKNSKVVIVKPVVKTVDIYTGNCRWKDIEGGTYHFDQEFENAQFGSYVSSSLELAAQKVCELYQQYLFDHPTYELKRVELVDAYNYFGKDSYQASALAQDSLDQLTNGPLYVVNYYEIDTQDNSDERQLLKADTIPFATEEAAKSYMEYIVNTNALIKADKGEVYIKTDPYKIHHANMMRLL